MKSPSEPVKIWVSSDGDGTVNVATEHGPVEGVMHIDITLEPLSFPKVELEIVGSPVHIEGILAGVHFLCPGCMKAVPHNCEGMT